MHFSKCLVCLLALQAVILVGESSAQRRFSRTTLEDLGLVRAWSTQTAAVYGDDLQLTLHLSQTHNAKVFDVISKTGTQSFAEGTAGPRVRIMTAEEAEFQADVAMRRLKLDGIEASVESRTVPDLTFIVQSGSGRVEAIDAETGRVKWQLALGNAREPGFAPAASDVHAAAVSGSTLQVAEIATGKLVIRKPTNNIPGGGPILTEKYAMVPLYRGAMEVFSLDPEEAKKGSSFLKSFGRPTSAPIEANGIICWPTDRGAVYFADANLGDDLFRVRTRSRIVGQVAHAPPNKFFVATEDSYLVCIDSQLEAIAWDHHIGAAAAATPYVLGETVFVVNREEQLHCVDWKTGSERWSKPGVKQIVVGIENKLYSVLANGRLASLDTASGRVLATDRLPDGASVVPNPTTDRLYFAIDGRISCYRDQKKPWPTIYATLKSDVPDEGGEEKGAPEEDPDLAASDSAGSDEPGEDPFATGDDSTMGDDPFGGTDAGDDPFGGADSGDDDPFGGAGDDPFGGADDSDDPFGISP